MATYTPPGWPAGVHPPGSDDFESTAVGWLLDVVPPDYRLHGVLRRYPVALATMARYHSAACVEGAREGYRTARTELAGALPPHAIDTVLAAYRKEGARLAATARAVGLVERALRGEVFTPKMSPSTAPPRMAEPRTGQPQKAEPQKAKPKAGAPKAGDANAGDANAGDANAGDANAGDANAGDAKAGDAKAGDANAGDPDDGQPAARAGTARTAARAGTAVRQRSERQRPARQREATPGPAGI